MADVQKQFEQFNDNIRLKQYAQNETLREKRDAVLNKLKTGLKRVFEEKGEPAPKFKIFNQGSYKLGTGIKPLDGDYDIDVGIGFEIGTAEEPDPVTVKRWVFDALEGHTNKIEVRRPCVTVFYQSGDEPLYHVDLAVYSGSSANSCGARRKGDTNSSERGQRFEGKGTVIRAKGDTLAGWSVWCPFSSGRCPLCVGIASY